MKDTVDKTVQQNAKTNFQPVKKEQQLITITSDNGQRIHVELQKAGD